MDAVPDRRVRRTRELLRRALTLLILERGYDRITVQDVLDRADVGRSTFYAHYRSKDDLLLSGADDLRGTLSAALARTLTPEGAGAPMLALFQHVEVNRMLYQATVGSRAAELGLRAVRRVLTDAVTEHIREAAAGADDSRREAAVAFLVSGLIGLLTWWLDCDQPIPAAEMCERFSRLAGGGLPALLLDR